MEWFMEMLATPTGLLLTIGVVIVAIFSIFFLIRHKTKKHRYLKIYHNLEKEFQRIQSIPVSTRLAKLERLGQNNVVYAQVYQEYSALFQSGALRFMMEIKQDFDQAKASLNLSNYHILNDQMKAIHVKVIAYNDKMVQLDSQLASFTKEEDSAHSLEAPIKELYRECKEVIQANQNEIDLFQDDIQAFMSGIEMKFDIYQEHLNKGNYIDAKELLQLVQTEVQNFSANIRELPQYASLVSKVLPHRINQAIDEYNEMQAKGYPLYHILASSIIASTKEELTSIMDLLRQFQYDGVTDRIAKIDLKIQGLRQSLNVEKESRIRFDQESVDIYNKAESLERQYIKYVREVSELGKVYEMNQNLEEKAEHIKNEVNQLSTIRRYLDGLNYGRQPYSFRVEKMDELNRQVIIVEGSMDQYKQDIIHMRDHSEDAFQLVDEASFRLKNAELEIRNLRLPRLRERYVEDFNNAYSLVEKLALVIAQIPIRIDLVSEFSETLHQVIERMEQNAKQEVMLSRKAEQLLLYANRFRPSFSDVARQVAKSEILFFEADFAGAIEITENAVSRFAPTPKVNV